MNRSIRISEPAAGRGVCGLVIIIICVAVSAVCHAAVSIDYTYDNLGRLKTVVRDDGQRNNYGYDEKGNIIVANGLDTDSDGLYDAEEAYYGTVAGNPDTDADGLDDGEELNLYGTDPNNADVDGDGLLDSFEVAYGFDPFVDEGAAGQDPDGDGLTNLQEQVYGTNPFETDSDGDNIADNIEISRGLNPAVNEPALMSIVSSYFLNPANVPVQADGDMNNDGVVNAADVLIATRILTGQQIITSLQSLHGDVAPLVGGLPSPDGRFDLGDLLVIQRKALGLVDF